MCWMARCAHKDDAFIICVDVFFWCQPLLRSPLGQNRTIDTTTWFTALKVTWDTQWHAYILQFKVTFQKFLIKPQIFFFTISLLLAPHFGFCQICKATFIKTCQKYRNQTHSSLRICSCGCSSGPDQWAWVLLQGLIDGSTESDPEPVSSDYAGPDTLSLRLLCLSLISSPAAPALQSWYVFTSSHISNTVVKTIMKLRNSSLAERSMATPQAGPGMCALLQEDCREGRDEVGSLEMCGERDDQRRRHLKIQDCHCLQWHYVRVHESVVAD